MRCAHPARANIVNFSVIFGSRVRGPLGGLVALVGLLGPPMVLIIIIGALYAHYGDLPALRRALIASRGGGRPDHVDCGQDGAAAVRNRAVGGPVIALATFGASASRSGRCRSCSPCARRSVWRSPGCGDEGWLRP